MSKILIISIFTFYNSLLTPARYKTRNHEGVLISQGNQIIGARHAHSIGCGANLLGKGDSNKKKCNCGYWLRNSEGGQPCQLLNAVENEEESP